MMSIFIGTTITLIAVIVFTPMVLFYGVCIRYGNRRKNCIALTIDDGPHPDSTPQVLQVLSSHHIVVTFFCPAKTLQQYPDLAKQIIAGGHSIQNHTFSHPLWFAFYSRRRIMQELKNAQQIYLQFGIKPIFFRSVAGVVTPAIVTAAKQMDLRIVAWSARARDGGIFSVRAQSAYRRLLRGMVPGGILLLHDHPRSPACEVIARIAQEASQRQLRFVTLAELLDNE